MYHVTRNGSGVHRFRRGGFFALLAAVLLALSLNLGAAAAQEVATAEIAWDALRRGGYIALIRRAAVAGTDGPPVSATAGCGDPSVLSEAGAAQARRTGDAFHQRGVPVEAVYASQWCAAVETATLLGLGPVKPFPALNSFAGQPDRKDIQMNALTPWVGNAMPTGNLVLVTHQGVATALTDLVPSEGEIVVIEPLGGGKIRVVGRIPPL